MHSSLTMKRRKNTHRRDANKAQSLEGYLWAGTAFEKGKMQIRCLTDTHVIDIKPPLTIIYVGDGCEPYSNNFFIPAKSELTSTDSSLVRHNYFQKFNEEYQDITIFSYRRPWNCTTNTKRNSQNT